MDAKLAVGNVCLQFSKSFSFRFVFFEQHLAHLLQVTIGKQEVVDLDARAEPEDAMEEGLDFWLNLPPLRVG